MNEEIDESEFYHQDFTTASEWEIFIARMEEIIHEWKIEDSKVDKSASNSSSQGIWNIKTEKICFADVEFIISYNRNTTTEEPDEETGKKKKNPVDTNYDFLSCNPSEGTHEQPVALWYGLNEFILINPANSSGITSESQIKVLLSSVNICIANSNCETPIFVQIREKWQRCYLGAHEGNGVRTSFEMIHLRKGPQHCQYLTGLLDLFKTKIMSPVSLDPITVSVQLTYNLTDFGTSSWSQDLTDVDLDNPESLTLFSLPFGVTVDPINTLVLKTTWSHLPDHLIVDSENYSDFDPMQAPKWTTFVKMTDQPVGLLSDCLSEFQQLLNNHMTIYDVLGDVAAQNIETENPLDLLTESKVPNISAVLKRAARNSLTKSRKNTVPLSETVLAPILYFLFPDAEEEPTHPYTEKRKERESISDSFHCEASTTLESLCKGFRTCGMNSLTWRLSIVLAQALHSLGGIRAFSYLWFEFSQEMRYRWDKSISIPGLAAGFPDPRTCLLHQKLQMLNCCIERKRAKATASTGVPPQEEDSSTDDEEFFDCATDKPEDDNSGRKKQKHSLWNQPVGRLGKFENLRLLKTGDSLYIPITQDPVPKTEDQLEEDTDVLLKLGSDAQGSELRARMMSASLLSDMESFKAANPGAVLEDFIRWYSPRDWIEDDEGEDEWGQRTGHLSSRMLISDNTWVQMWSSAKPVPAHRQKRLFDDTREAEKVLHFLESRTLSQVVEAIAPVLCHAAIYKTQEECEQVKIEVPESAAPLRQMIKTVERFSREGKVSSRRFDQIIQEVTALELEISQANSLLYKFNPSGAPDENLSLTVAKLTAGKEVEIEGRADLNLGKRIVAMFTEAQKTANLILTEQGTLENRNLASPTPFAQANEREFVMRVSAVRPAVYSTRCPQFLRAILSKNEFRIAGAFSEDVVFF